MTKYFKRWKKDKKFRNNVLLGIILLYIFGGNFGTVETQSFQPQATCNQYNNPIGNFFGIDDEVNIQKCKNIGCNVEVSYAALQIPPFLLNSRLTCISCVETGKFTRMGADACCEGGAIKVGAVNKLTKCGDLTGDCYECTKASEASITACKSWQKPFDTILDGIWKKNDFDCSTGAYLVIGFAVFALLAVI